MKQRLTAAARKHEHLNIPNVRRKNGNSRKDALELKQMFWPESTCLVMKVDQAGSDVILFYLAHRGEQLSSFRLAVDK